MESKVVDLYQYFNLAKQEGARADLTIYPSVDENSPTILIFPGGAYTHYGEREAEPVALRFMQMGFNTAVLRYSLVPNTFPNQLIEGCLAVCYLRENAKALGFGNKIAVMGFSAGGHLAGCVATLNSHQIVREVIKDRNARPDLAVLCYPVLISNEDYISDSIKGVSGGDKQIIELLSLDKQVDEKTPPCFIWTTFDDGGVPMQNSVRFSLALRKVNVKHELHVFEHGRHGLSLATKETAVEGFEKELIIPSVAKWVNMAEEFIKRNLKE